MSRQFMSSSGRSVSRPTSSVSKSKPKADVSALLAEKSARTESVSQWFDEFRRRKKPENSDWDLRAIRSTDRVALMSVKSGAFLKVWPDGVRCDDCEGSALTLALCTGAIRYLTDVKIMVSSKCGLAKDKDRVVVDLKSHKFLFESPVGRNTLRAGDRVHVFIERSRTSPKQYWHVTDDDSVALSTGAPQTNESFVVLKHGLPFDNSSLDTVNSLPLAGDSGANARALPKPPRCPAPVLDFALSREAVNALVCAVAGDWIAFDTDEMGLSLVSRESAVRSVPTLARAVEDFARIQGFAQLHSAPEYGSVSEALCASIRSHLSDFSRMCCSVTRDSRTLVSALSRGGRLLSQLRALCDDLRRGRRVGGALLNHLDTTLQRTAGFQQWTLLLRAVLRDACVPYFELLAAWIDCGTLPLRHCEFFVSERQSESASPLSDEFWRHRYQISSEVPYFARGSADAVLSAGKYWNVLRQSGIEVRRPMRAPLTATTLSVRVSNALEESSRLLFSVLRKDFAIFERLRSVSRFWLLLDGSDWMSNLLDTAQSELQCVRSEADISTLSRLLEVALKASSVESDRFVPDFSVALRSKSLRRIVAALASARSRMPMEASALSSAFEPLGGDSMDVELTVADCFSLKLCDRFPASVLFTASAVSRYQLLFRLQFVVRCAERNLAQCWRICRRRDSCALRMRMASFVRALLAYLCSDVLSPKFKVFVDGSVAAQTVDSLLAKQESFLRQSLQLCFLTTPRLSQCLFDVLLCVRGFCTLMLDTGSDEHIDLSTVQTEFDSDLCKFLKMLHSSSISFASLTTTLDFNGFYARNLLSY